MRGNHHPALRPMAPSARSRGRLLTLVALLLAGSLVAFAAVLAVASSYQYRWDLGDSLGRTAMAFRYTRSRDLEQLTRQADLVASDPRLQQYREALRLTSPEVADYRVIQDSLRKHLRDIFATAGGDALLLVGPDGRVQLGVERPSTSPAGASPVEPSEATSPAEGGLGSKGARAELPAQGSAMEAPLVDAVFEDGVSRAGYLRMQPHGAIFTAAAVPLRRGSRLDGVLLLGERVTEKTLADWGQGLSNGIVLVVADRQVLAAHDRRAARRPSPSMLSSLEKAMSSWEAPAEPEETLRDGREPTPPVSMDIGGREWLELAVGLGGRKGQRPVGWVVFLGDTSSLDDKVTREAWILAETGGAVLVVMLGLAWLSAGWVLRPLEEKGGGPAA